MPHSRHDGNLHGDHKYLTEIRIESPSFIISIYRKKEVRSTAGDIEFTFYDTEHFCSNTHYSSTDVQITHM